jgi:hypothetical protein
MNVTANYADGDRSFYSEAIMWSSLGGAAATLLVLIDS